MPIAEDQIKQLIIDTVGDVDARGNPYPDPADTGIIASNIDVIWESHSGIPSSLRKLLSKRDAIELVLARVINKVDTKNDTLSVEHSQRTRALQRKLDTTIADIAKQVAGAALVSGAASIDEIAAFEPKYPHTDREFLIQIGETT
jgi:hypothetical protein